MTMADSRLHDQPRIAELEAQLAEAKDAAQEHEAARLAHYELWREAQARAEKAEADSARLRAALEQVEWTVYGDRERCPWCLSFRLQGHEVDCARQLALGQTCRNSPLTREKVS